MDGLLNPEIREDLLSIPASQRIEKLSGVASARNMQIQQAQ